MSFFRRDHLICHWIFLLALAGFLTPALKAEVIDYSADPRLSVTKVSTERVRARYVPLSEVIALVENQSDLKFVYDPDRLPMSAEVMVESRGVVTVAQLLAEISSQIAVIFRQRNGLVAIWAMGPDDVVAPPAVPIGASPTDPVVAVSAERTEAEVPVGASEEKKPEETAVPPTSSPSGLFSSEALAAEPPTAPAMPQIDLPSSETPSDSGEVLQLEKFKIEGKAPANSQVVMRQKAAVAVDMVTSKDFSKFIATDVSDIVIRMPGFSTTTRGSFAVVRGLAERYNPIMLDGLVLPSSDPERQTPELDIFPTRLVDAVVVNKVFEPRLPATASGGAVDLRTKPLPEGRYAQVQFGLRAESGALANEDFYRSNTSGLWDHFALGSKDRPAAPTTESERYKRASISTANWMGSTGSFPLGTRLSLTYEDRVDLGGDGRAFGFSFSLGYDSSASSEEGRTFSPAGGVNVSQLPGLVAADGSFLAPIQGEDYAEYEQEVRIGGLINLGYAFDENHTLALSLFFSQIGKENVNRTFNGFSQLNENTVEQLGLLYDGFSTGTLDPDFVGINGNDGFLQGSESIYYRQRNLTDLKLSGEHKLGETRTARIDWSVASIQASQEEPDFSFLGYSERLRDDPSLARFQILYGQPTRTPTRFWREVEEKTRAGRLDWQSTFDLAWMTGVQLKAGLYYDDTARAFAQNAYYLSGGGASEAGTLAELVEAVRGSDFGTTRGAVPTPAATSVDRKLGAAHLSAAFPLLADRSWAHRLELMFGARLESYRSNVAGRGTYGNQSSADYYLELLNRGDGRIPDFRVPGTVVLPTDEFAREVDERTVHPSVALTWSPVERFNVRLAYARTVARPSLREIGPYFTNDDVTNEVQHGNVFLDTSRVENYDFRVEYFFPQSRDLIALSFFGKTIEKPIEKVSDAITSGGFSAIGWFNNPNHARLKGAEMEFAKNFGFLSEVGSWFTVGGNATIIDASVAIGPGEPGVPGTKRRLFDQPEWIANAWGTFDLKPVGFSTTLSWFSISDVLRSIETEKWSTYVASHSRLDLTMSQRLGSQWMLRLSAKNLADPDLKFIADPDVTTDEIAYRTFKDGRSYSLTATYDF